MSYSSSSTGTSGGSHNQFTSTERDVLYAVTIAATCLSIFGTSLITLSYCCFAHLRTFPYKLIVLMSISDLLGSISYLIPTGHSDDQHVTDSCIAQASMSQFFTVAAFLWTSVFSFNIYLVLVKRQSNIEKYEKYYHLIVWGISGSFLIINLSLQSFGQTLIWCWINNQHNLLRILTFYAPLIIIFLFDLAIYIIVGRYSGISISDEKQAAINKKMRLYLLVFFFVRIWSLMNRFQNIVSPNNPVFALYFMHALFSPLQGFFNSLVYGLNGKIKNHYLSLFCPNYYKKLTNRLYYTNNDRQHQNGQPNTTNDHDDIISTYYGTYHNESPQPTILNNYQQQQQQSQQYYHQNTPAGYSPYHTLSGHASPIRTTGNSISGSYRNTLANNHTTNQQVTNHQNQSPLLSNYSYR